MRRCRPGPPRLRRLPAGRWGGPPRPARRARAGRGRGAGAAEGQAGATVSGTSGRSYTLAEELGRGGAGTTYRAAAAGPDGAAEEVAVKVMSFRGARGNWKALELFEREARTLRNLVGARCSSSVRAPSAED